MRETRDSIADIWGDRTPYVDNWPTRVDERIVKEPKRLTKTLFEEPRSGSLALLRDPHDLWLITRIKHVAPQTLVVAV